MKSQFFRPGQIVSCLFDRPLVINRSLLTAIAMLAVLGSQVVLAQQGAAGSNKPQTDTKTQSVELPEAWPSKDSIDRISDIGRHKAVIFSPDFAELGNREFYEKLGFLYIQDASWIKALNQVIARNYWHPEDRIDTLILETHGTNGNGLKLQTGPAPRAARSYISIAALQEKLDGIGVKLCVIGACNSGRLFRPEIYTTLNPDPHDRLFLPPTLGIINASKNYDPASSKVVVVRRAESEIETTSDGETSELSSLACSLMGLDQAGASALGRRPLHFAVSNLLVQMLLHDPSLKLTSTGYSSNKSKNDLSEDESDDLFQRFLSFIDSVAVREYQLAHGGEMPAASLTASRISTDTPTVAARPVQPVLRRTKKRVVRRVID